jgi:hypothetical protein
MAATMILSTSSTIFPDFIVVKFSLFLTVPMLWRWFRLE